MKESITFVALTFKCTQHKNDAIHTLGDFFPEKIDKLLTEKEQQKRDSNEKGEYKNISKFSEFLNTEYNDYYLGLNFVLELVNELFKLNFHTLNFTQFFIKNKSNDYTSTFDFDGVYSLLKVLRVVCIELFNYDVFAFLFIYINICVFLLFFKHFIFLYYS